MAPIPAAKRAMAATTSQIVAPGIVTFVRQYCAVCLFGVLASAEQATSPPTPTPEELLRQVIETYRIGDFEGAWNSYMEFFRHPQRNELDYSAFVDCYLFEQCPDVGVLGEILGRPRNALANLETFCPRLKQHAQDAPPESMEQRRAAQETYDQIVVNALGTTCSAWAKNQRAQLNETPVPTSVVVEALPIIFYEPQDGGFAPAIDVLGGKRPMRPRVDTGASSSVLDITRDEAVERGDVDLSDTRQSATGIYAFESLIIGKLDMLRMGKRDSMSGTGTKSLCTIPFRPNPSSE